MLVYQSVTFVTKFTMEPMEPEIFVISLKGTWAIFQEHHVFGGNQNRAATKCPESHWIRLPSMGNAVHEFQTGIGSPFRIWNHLGVSTQVMSKWKDIYNSKIHISHHWIDMSIIFIKIFQPFHLYNFPAYVVFFRLSVSCNEPYFWSFNHSVAMVKMVPPPQVFG